MSKTLAQKLDWLFDKCRTEQGRQFTYGQVQRATQSRITASYVWKLRTGAISNPSLSALQVLGGFFAVPLQYFAEGGEYLEPTLSVLMASTEAAGSRDSMLRLIGEHAGGLPEPKLRAAAEVIASLQA